MNDAITLRGGYMREYIDRPVQDHTMNLVQSAEEYSQIAIRSGRTKRLRRREYFRGRLLRNRRGLPQADRRLLHVSGQGLGYDLQSQYRLAAVFPLSSPRHIAEPTFPPNTGTLYKSGYVRNHNFVVGDQIEFDEQWSALVGANYSMIQSQSLDSSGARSAPDYDEARLSPSASLLFKPVEAVTLYGSYIEGLEQGGVAPDTAANSGQILAPWSASRRKSASRAMSATCC